MDEMLGNFFDDIGLHIDGLGALLFEHLDTDGNGTIECQGIWGDEGK
jgi:hypothetical protein